MQVVAITGQVIQPLIGRDAFQEVDITGITLPVTKHNYLVNRVQDLAPTFKEAFHLATTGRPGPVLIDIPKTLSCKSTSTNIRKPFSGAATNLPQCQDRGAKGWRRDGRVAGAGSRCSTPPPRWPCFGAGFVVVAAGGGGIPTARRDDGTPLRRGGGHRQGPHRGPAGAWTIGADVLVIATDVTHATLHFGTAQAAPAG